MYHDPINVITIHLIFLQQFELDPSDRWFSSQTTDIETSGQLKMQLVKFV